MIVNEFRAKFLGNLITIVSHITSNEKDKGFESLKKTLENNVMKYKQKNLLYQMKQLVNQKIKALLDTLNSENNQSKKQAILNELNQLNDSLQKIENTIGENCVDNSLYSKNSFETRRCRIYSTENCEDQTHKLYKLITPIPERLKQTQLKTDPSSGLTPLHSESAEMARKINFKTPNDHQLQSGNPLSHNNNNNNVSSSEEENKYVHFHNTLNSFIKTDEYSKLIGKHNTSQNMNNISNNKNTQQQNTSDHQQNSRLEKSDSHSMYKMFDACINSIQKDQLLNADIQQITINQARRNSSQQQPQSDEQFGNLSNIFALKSQQNQSQSNNIQLSPVFSHKDNSPIQVQENYEYQGSANRMEHLRLALGALIQKQAERSCFRRWQEACNPGRGGERQ